MRRAGLLVAVVVVLAGCSALGLGGSSGPEGPLPAAVADDGTVNETKLFQTHRASMNETTVRVEHRNGEDTSVLFVGDGATYALEDRSVTWRRGPLEVTNDTLDTEYSVTYAENRTIDTRPSETVMFGLSVRLSSAEYEHAGTRTENGTRLHELELVEKAGLGKALGHYTGRMLVDEQGRVHRLAGEVGENESVADRYRYAFDWDVETVPEPAWIDRVPRGSAERTAGGSVLAVTLTGGRAVPAGETLRFEHGDTGGEVTLDEPFEPGDTLYLGLRESGEDRLVVSRSPIDGDGFVSLEEGRTTLRGEVTLADGTTVSLRFAVGSSDLFDG